MPIYALTEELLFPPTDHAEEDGLLAVGGDLSPQRLILAYSQGIFPWYSEGEPILWFSPAPRMVLFPEALHIQKSMRPILRKGAYRFSMDEAFEAVIEACSEREDQEGTWITQDMKRAYIRLHQLGIAHSAELWMDDQLAGGLYGLSLGNVFFGESMFSRRPNASKLAFYHLVTILRQEGFRLIDCQMSTEHLERMGAEELSRLDFESALAQGLKSPTRQGSWSEWSQGAPHPLGLSD